MIFEEQIARKPDHYPWANDFIKAMHDGHWTDREFSFASDVQDFQTSLDDQEKEIAIRALSAIGQIEIAVKKFWAKLGDNLPHPSLTDLGYVFANVEVIHNGAYERLLEVLGIDEIFEQNLQLEWMSGRVNYLRKYTHRYYKDNKKQFVYALILFTLFVENVSLFSQFYVVKWFGRRGLLKDTNQQVSYTIREEDLHAKAGIKIIQTLRQEHPELFDSELQERILQEAQEAVKAESKIIDWMVNGIQKSDLSAPLLKNFVESRINDSLLQIGYPTLFETNEELSSASTWFDEEALGNVQTDFFHARPVEYSKKNKNFDADSLF